MALWYTIVIQETEPVKPQTGWLWLMPSISQLRLWIRTRWTDILAGGTITLSYRTGFHWKDVKVQETMPDPQVGRIWIKESLGQRYIFIDMWIPF